MLKIKAEIISTGTELLLGKTLNTSSFFITEQLTGLGIEVDYHTTIGDNKERLKEALVQALDRSQLIFLTGGLGPTVDDMTKELAAEVLQLRMVFKQELMDEIKRFYNSDKEIPPGSEKQAYFPAGAVIIPNSEGTAPGAIIEKENKTIIILPGPPSELEPMFEQHVLPVLRQKLGVECEQLHTKVLKVFGLGESELEKELQGLLGLKNPFITLIDQHTYIDLRLTVNARDKAEVGTQLEEVERKIRKRLGNRIFAINNQTHSLVIGQLLRENKLTLSTAESCSGGLLGSAITDEAGSSDYYLGGVVSYSNSAKETLIGVKRESLLKFGAVSKTVAQEMAEGVRRTLGADLALATTGIAGPGGGSDEKPVGLVYIALASPRGTEVKKCIFNGSRKSIREMTVETALNMLRLYLLEK